MNFQRINSPQLTPALRSRRLRRRLALLGLVTLISLGSISGDATPTNDPIFSQQAKLTLNGGAANDLFGNYVALSGDWAVFGHPQKDVGGNQDQGAAYVYQRAGATWTLKQTLTASDGGAFDRFGLGLAISGSTMVIGAHTDNIGKGAAYVFALVGNTWVERQKLTASDGQAKDNFGVSVAVSGQSIVVGAPGEGITDTHTPGAAYVFILSGTTWAQQQKLTAPDGVPGGGFGTVTISGDAVVVSAHDNPWLGIDHGAVYLFKRSGGWWNFQQKLTSPNPVPLGHYGHIAVLSGDTLVVGGEVATPFIEETIYVYAQSGGIWGLQQKLSDPDGVGAGFGLRFEFDGERIVAGCTNDDILGAEKPGSAYVFARTGTTWTLQQKLIAADGQAQDYFGQSVALSGGTIIVGAYLDDIGANQDQGSAYVFNLQTGNSLPTITPAGPYTVQQGSTISNLLIATVNDQETPAGSLLIDHDLSWGFTLSNVLNNGGSVTATINGACGGGLGEYKTELNVIDSNYAAAAAALTVFKTANTAPTLGNYPSVIVLPGASVTSTPSAGPTDNGTVNLTTTVTPAGFTGTMAVNQVSGAVTISNAAPAGVNYTVTVKATDNCTAFTTRAFSFSILKYEAPPVLTSSPNPSFYGQTVTFRAVITPPPGAPMPTGAVQFKDNGVNLGARVPLVNGIASLATSSLSLGSHQITAAYSGDSSYNPSSSTVTQVIQR